MVRRGLVQCVSQELPYRQRIGRAPGNSTFRIQTFEVADQKRAKVHTRRQARPTVRTLLIETSDIAALLWHRICAHPESDSGGHRMHWLASLPHPSSRATDPAAALASVVPSPCLMDDQNISKVTCFLTDLTTTTRC